MTLELALLYTQTVLVFAAAVFFLDSLANMKYSNKGTWSMWMFCIAVTALFITSRI